MMVNINNVIINTVASKAYDEINPKILKNYLIFPVASMFNTMWRRSSDKSCQLL